MSASTIACYPYAKPLDEALGFFDRLLRDGILVAYPVRISQHIVLGADTSMHVTRTRHTPAAQALTDGVPYELVYPRLGQRYVLQSWQDIERYANLHGLEHTTDHLLLDELGVGMEALEPKRKRKRAKARTTTYPVLSSLQMTLDSHWEPAGNGMGRFLSFERKSSVVKGPPSSLEWALLDFLR